EDPALVGLVPLGPRIGRCEERFYVQSESVPGVDVVTDRVEVFVREADHLVRDRTDVGFHRPPERSLVGLDRGALADGLEHAGRETLVAIEQMRAARALEDGQELSAHEGRMARAAPV